MAGAAFDQRTFRQALGQFPTGVCVVTCSVEGRPLGMTMNSFNSLSLDPPLVLFSINGRAASLPLWEKAASYAVHVLSENQKDVSDRFARPQSNK
jgi:flavin reductase (DIM6/NTAB) family NADH-FMN oxidoreductase RutF